MFGALTKLFDRNFAVGYFLPAVIFLCVTTWLAVTFFPLSLAAREWLAGYAKDNSLTAIGLAALAAWLLGVSFLAANKRIYRLKEGYGWWNQKGNPLRRRQLRQYLLLKNELTELEKKRARFTALDQEAPADLLAMITDTEARLVTFFPDSREWILPFEFGNLLRAFEVYSRRMYGFGSIHGWSRLLGVVPKDYRDLVDGAKAQVDFLVNLWFASLLLILEYFGLVAWTRGWPFEGWQNAIFPLLALTSAFAASYWARHAARDWGEVIKATVDLYLPDLRRRLGFEPPRDRDEERRQWECFSEAIRFHDPSLLPALSAETAPEGPPPPAPAEPAGPLAAPSADTGASASPH